MPVRKGVENLIVEIIHKCLTDLLGPIAAEAMNFYLDPSIAVKNPDAYASRLEAVCGPKPSAVILRRIEETLSERAGIRNQNWNNFAQFMAVANNVLSTLRSGA